MTRQNTVPGITLAYPATFKQMGGELVVRFRDIPGAITSGHDDDDAFNQACDALTVAVAGMLQDGDPIPVPSTTRRGEYTIPVEPNVATKIFLSDAMRATRMTQSALACKLDTDTRTIQRLLDPQHKSTFSSLSKALQEVGVSVTMTLVDTGRNKRMLQSSSSTNKDGIYVLRPRKAVRGRPTSRVEA